MHLSILKSLPGIKVLLFLLSPHLPYHKMFVLLNGSEVPEYLLLKLLQFHQVVDGDAVDFPVFILR
jgi:hypothetical protein